MVSRLSGRYSDSLLKRRYRPIQALGRSTTQRRGDTVTAGPGGGSTSIGYQLPRRGRSDDLQGPAAFFFHPCAEPLAAIRHVLPDRLPSLAGLVGRREEPRSHVRIPQTGGVDEDTHEETRRLTEEMALAPIELLRAVIPMRPPVSVVFTVWASMMAAAGWGWCPMRVQTSSRS
jgi:hypothetical protein